MTIRSLDPNKKIHTPQKDNVAPNAPTTEVAQTRGAGDVDAEQLSAGANAAKRAMGFVDGAAGGDVKTVGAKAAAHGMGFVDGVKKTWKKGLLGALTGMMFINSLAPALTTQVRAPEKTGPPAITQTLSHQEAKQFSPQETRKAFELQRAGERDINDAQLVLSKWESQDRRDPSFKVSGDSAREMLTEALKPATLPAGGDLAKFARDQLGADTRALIGGALDSRMKFDDDARALLELAIGRTHAVSVDGKLKVLGDQSGGMLHLVGVPGAQVEAINLSTIPTKRFHQDDTFAIGKIGADGKLDVNMEMQAGDHLRLRLRLPDGTTTQFLDFKSIGLGADTRAAEVAVFRIGLTDAGNGEIKLTNINSSRPVSEPGATLSFVNMRTNVVTNITLDKEGTFPADTKIPGAPGDQFSLRVTDGVHDVELKDEIGKVQVSQPGRTGVVEGIDIEDPTLHKDELDEQGKPKFSLVRFRGPLFENAAQPGDVVQGQIGDCYFPAAVSAIAKHVPGHFEQMMKMVEVEENGVNKVWYEVTFKEKDWSTGKFKDVVVKVDGDLYVRSYGGPLYGSDDGRRDAEDMEMWFPILEKAYAQWKGASYESIGNGGHVSNVFKDLMGVDVDDIWLSGGNADNAWKTITEAVDAKRPVGAGTYHDDSKYANTGVYGNHAYSIFDYKEENGTKYVQLRNPWGESEPYPGDGKNDGVFWLKLDDFMKLYQTLYFVTD